MAERILAAQKREITTKGAVKSLRREGRVPGVIYASGFEPIAFSVNEKDIIPIVFTKENYVINLQVEGEKNHLAIMKDVQFHPVSDRVVHFDLHALTEGQLIQVEVPLNFVGQAAGVKAGGTLKLSSHKITIECLPKDIPSHLDINLAPLEAGQSIHAGSLNFENIKIISNSNLMIASVERGRDEKTK